MKLSNETYDILKWIAQILLPALGTLYFALAKIWGLPYGNEINQTIILIATFLAGTLEVSTYFYHKDGEGGAK